MTQRLLIQLYERRLPLADRSKSPVAIAPDDGVKCVGRTQSMKNPQPMSRRMAATGASNAVNGAPVVSLASTASALSP
ncbi:MAG: hypothetical protein HQ514_05885 [Rhodospirillales bacterium]|jgi:hypothetical protein|nr:hypothetical protein [Rhodospirillales bacterium]